MLSCKQGELMSINLSRINHIKINQCIEWSYSEPSIRLDGLNNIGTLTDPGYDSFPVRASKGFERSVVLSLLYLLTGRPGLPIFRIRARVIASARLRGMKLSKLSNNFSPLSVDHKGCP